MLNRRRRDERRYPRARDGDGKTRNVGRWGRYESSHWPEREGVDGGTGNLIIRDEEHHDCATPWEPYLRQTDTRELAKQNSHEAGRGGKMQKA